MIIFFFISFLSSYFLKTKTKLSQTREKQLTRRDHVIVSQQLANICLVLQEVGPFHVLQRILGGLVFLNMHRNVLVQSRVGEHQVDRRHVLDAQLLDHLRLVLQLGPRRRKSHLGQVAQSHVLLLVRRHRAGVHLRLHHDAVRVHAALAALRQQVLAQRQARVHAAGALHSVVASAHLLHALVQRGQPVVGLDPVQQLQTQLQPVDLRLVERALRGVGGPRRWITPVGVVRRGAVRAFCSAVRAIPIAVQHLVIHARRARRLR